jgi:hypothetical protein
MDYKFRADPYPDSLLRVQDQRKARRRLSVLCDLGASLVERLVLRNAIVAATTGVFRIALKNSA